MKIRTAFFISVILAFCLISYGAANLRFTSALAITPESPAIGSIVTWKAQNADAVNVRMIGGVDGNTIYNQTIPLLPAGQTRTIVFNWTALSGSYNFWFHLNPDNLTGDPYPSNNYIERSINVGNSASYVNPTLPLTSTPRPANTVTLTRDQQCKLRENSAVDLFVINYEIKNHVSDNYMKTLDITFRNAGWWNQ